MNSVARRRLEPIRLPIVEVDYLIRVLKDPKTRQALYGVRRQIVERATQSLELAKRNQIDGQVELDVGDHRLFLQAAALTVEWMAELLSYQFGDDEQT